MSEYRNLFREILSALPEPDAYSRANLKVDTIYRFVDDSYEHGDGYFVTPDGIAGTWYDTAKAAREDTGIESTVITIHQPLED